LPLACQGLTLFHFAFLVLTIGHRDSYQLEHEPLPGAVIDLIHEQVASHPQLYDRFPGYVPGSVVAECVFRSQGTIVPRDCVYVPAGAVTIPAGCQGLMSSFSPCYLTHPGLLQVAFVLSFSFGRQEWRKNGNNIDVVTWHLNLVLSLARERLLAFVLWPDLTTLVPRCSERACSG
jgi:hypothetical protein